MRSLDILSCYSVLNKLTTSNEHGTIDWDLFTTRLINNLKKHDVLMKYAHDKTIPLDEIALNVLHYTAFLEGKLIYHEDVYIRLEAIRAWISSRLTVFGVRPLEGLTSYISTLRNNDTKKEEEETMFNEERVITCKECGQVVSIENAREVDGEWYCEECFDEKFVECSECGEIIERDDAFEYDGEYYCEDCRDENFAICERCGEWYPREDMIYVESEERYYCKDCIERNHTQCERCGEWVGRYDTYTVYVNEDRDSEEWCQDCYEWHSHTCDNCDETYSEDVVFDDDDCCPRCSNSWRVQDTADIKLYRAPRGVTNYSYKPTPCFCVAEDQDQSDDNILLGFELEVDKPFDETNINDAANFVNDTSKYTYVKHDGSLDDGMEIVSHPATIEYHLSKKEMWGDIFNQLLSDYGFKSHDAKTCGLHVHVSLHALESRNSFAVNNMLFLMDHFWDRFVRFSRRTEYQLSRWAMRYSTVHGDYEDLKKQAKETRDRYYALNLQNKHTVEIRMFRGTLNLETFIATLQFVDVFAKKCCSIANQRELQAMTWEELVKSDYTELNAYLKRRGLAGTDEEIRAAEKAIRQKEEERLRAEREAAERRERERAERQARAREELINSHPNFPISSRVRCVRSADNNPSYVGRVGTVINYMNHFGDTRIPILVHFDDEGDYGHDGSMLNGDYIPEHCWYCEEESLELIVPNDGLFF